MTLLENVLATARKYLGQTEKTSNTGWNDPAFEAKMKLMGWAKPNPWCAYFTELVWKEGFDGHPLLPLLNTLFSAAATATFANFNHTDKFKTGKTPKPGALVVWRHGTGWQGHIGIVSAIIDNTTFKSIEGNTNEAGSREGTAVLEKTRKLGEPFKPSGLNIVGFVYLPE